MDKVKINQFEYENLCTELGFSNQSYYKNGLFYYRKDNFLIQIYRTSNVSIRIYKNSMIVNIIHSFYEPKFQRDEVFNIDGKYIIITNSKQLAKILNTYTGLFKEYLRKDKWIKINSQPHEQS